MPEKNKTTGMNYLVDTLTQWLSRPERMRRPKEIERQVDIFTKKAKELGITYAPEKAIQLPSLPSIRVEKGFLKIDEPIVSKSPQEIQKEKQKLKGEAYVKELTDWKQAWTKKQEEHKEYLIEFNKGKEAWEKWEKERMEKVMEMYKYAQEHNISSYEPTSGQVALGMPFGVPKNIAPLLMQGITQQENQRQMEEYWQKQMGGLEPEVLAGLPTDVTRMPAEYQEAKIQSELVKEEKNKDKARAIGLLGQYITSLIQRAPEEGIDPSERIMQIIQTATPEQLEEEFGYPLTYEDIINAFSSIMKITMGEYGG